MNNKTFFFFFLFTLGQRSYSAIQNDAEKKKSLAEARRAKAREEVEAKTNDYMAIIKTARKSNNLSTINWSDIDKYTRDLELLSQDKGLATEDAHFVIEQALSVIDAQRSAIQNDAAQKKMLAEARRAKARAEVEAKTDDYIAIIKTVRRMKDLGTINWSDIDKYTHDLSSLSQDPGLATEDAYFVIEQALKVIDAQRKVEDALKIFRF